MRLLEKNDLREVIELIRSKLSCDVEAGCTLYSCDDGSGGTPQPPKPTPTAAGNRNSAQG